MTSPVGSQHSAAAVQHASKPSPSTETFPGKSADSVGHLAKASVLETDASEPNAQGKAASRIARMDLTMLSPIGSGEDQEPDTATDAPTQADGTEASDPAV